MLDWQERFYQTSAASGFHDDDANTSVDRRLMLVVSELVEAQDELRAGHEVTEVYFETDPQGNDKPEGFPIELADAAIRIFDLAHTYGINLPHWMYLKDEYNQKRPHKHGKAF